MIYTSVLQPRWANPQHTQINCLVKFADLKKELPFTADPNDIEAHGREIFHRCVSGEFGAVGECDWKLSEAGQSDNGLRNEVRSFPEELGEFQKFLDRANVEKPAARLSV